MAWTIDKSRAEFLTLTKSEQAKWYDFQNRVNRGTHPKTAASEARCDDYKELAGGRSQYQIRLSDGTRATFFVDDRAQRVTVAQVGGHT